MVQITEPGPSLTDSDIHALERKVGATLPEDYRAFLLRWNGGVPEPGHFPIEGDDRENRAPSGECTAYWM
jgi:hypothetical protein